MEAEAAFELSVALPDHRHYDFEAEQRSLHYIAGMPEPVSKFLVTLWTAVKQKAVDDVAHLFDTSFPRLSDVYFRQAPWPQVDAVCQHVSSDSLFQMLYRELYYRHSHLRASVPVEHRIGAWQNYVALFDELSDENVAAQVDLSNSWLWAMVEEFLYQFEGATASRWRFRGKGDDDQIDRLRQAQNAWHAANVIGVLEKIVERSQIKRVLSGDKTVPPPHVLYMLGAYALVGLVKLHCITADYRQALGVLAPIDIMRTGVFARHLPVQVTLFNYVSLAYLMLRRHADAVRCLRFALLFIARMERFHTRALFTEHFARRVENMYALLAVALTMNPQRVSELVHAELREKYGEQMQRMQRGDESAVEEAFVNSCGRFVNPALPADAAAAGDHVGATQDPLRQQVRVFLSEFKQQALMPTVRSFLRLYSTVPLSKLSEYVEVDDATFRASLLGYKRQTHTVQWVAGAPLSGERVANSDIDFEVNGDTVKVLDAQQAQSVVDQLARAIGDVSRAH